MAGECWEKRWGGEVTMEVWRWGSGGAWGKVVGRSVVGGVVGAEWGGEWWVRMCMGGSEAAWGEGL